MRIIMDIGKRMKELRIQYGLTQQELADRSELTKGFISQLERNQNSPSIGTLLDIIQCLGTTPAEFFTDEEPEQIVFEKDDYFEKISEDGKIEITSSTVPGTAILTVKDSHNKTAEIAVKVIKRLVVDNSEDITYLITDKPVTIKILDGNGDYTCSLPNYSSSYIK